MLKALIVIQNIWFTSILKGEVSDLFIVLSTLMAIGVITDLNSNTEINRINDDFEKTKLFSLFLQIKGVFSVFVSIAAFIYFRYYLGLDILKSLIAFSIPFDSISGLIFVKYLALHEVKKYHIYTFLVSTIKIIFPIFAYIFVNSIEAGILCSSIISTLVLIFSSGFKKVQFQRQHIRFFSSILSIGFVLNLVQRLDVFLIAKSTFFWKDSFYSYNRFYEFALFPLSLIIGYMYKNLDQTNISKYLISRYQFLLVLLLLILAFVLMMQNFHIIVIILIIKYCFVTLGMFFLPVYSKKDNYSRTKLFAYLSLILILRIGLPFFFDIGISILLLTEVGLFFVLLSLAKNKFV